MLPMVYSPYGPVSILELVGAFSLGCIGLLILILIVATAFKILGVWLDFLFN